MTDSKPILVTGATGTQGGATARRLRAAGQAVRALTRKADSPAAKALAALGVDVREGDIEDSAALDSALSGAGGLFAVCTPFGGGTEVETKHGILLADAAKRAGAFLVYSSVASADQKTGIPHFDSKFEVEKHIRDKGIEGTIIAPVFFMENIRGSKAQLREGVYPSPLTEKRVLQQIAVEDIAAVAVSVFANRAKHAGKRYDIAGDELTSEESAKILSRATGKEIHHVQIPLDVIRKAMGEDGALMFAWFERVGYSADRSALASAFPDVHFTSFESWARDFDWKGFLEG